jgi:hypothetical protein
MKKDKIQEKKNKKERIKGKDVYFISDKSDDIEYEKELKAKYEKRSKDKTNSK